MSFEISCHLRFHVIKDFMSPSFGCINVEQCSRSCSVVLSPLLPDCSSAAECSCRQPPAEHSSELRLSPVFLLTPPLQLQLGQTLGQTCCTQHQARLTPAQRSARHQLEIPWCSFSANSNSSRAERNSSAAVCSSAFIADSNKDDINHYSHQMRRYHNFNSIF